jgi:hypothetical protein
MASDNTQRWSRLTSVKWPDRQSSPVFLEAIKTPGHLDVHEKINNTQNMRSRPLFLSFVFLLYLSAGRSAGAETAGNAGNEGTVYGSVLDAQSGAPVAGANVYLLNTRVCRLGGAKMNIRTARGEYLLPHVHSAAAHSSTGSAGMFRITGVPAPQPFKSYTVFIRASGYADFVIHNAAVYSGNARALRIGCRLAPGALPATWFEGSDREAPLNYRSERE